MKLTRRHILAAAAAIPAAGLLGTGTLALRWYDKAPGEGLSLLSDDEYGFVQALAEAWMPGGGTPSLSGADANLGAWLDEMLTHMAANQVTLLKMMLQILDDAPLLTDRTRYTTLPLARRTEILRGWMASKKPLFRGAVTGVIVLMGMGWSTHPDVVRVIAPMFRCGWSR